MSRMFTNGGVILIFIAAMMWATDAPFRVVLTQDLSSGFIVLIEHLFDVLIVLPLLLFRRAHLKQLSARDWASIVAIGIGGSALATFAFTQAFSYVNPSIAILLQKLQPIIAISLASIILRERLTRYFWLWAAIAIASAYVLSFPRLVPQLYEGEAFNPHIIGIALALIAAFLWGGSTVLGKYALRHVDAVTVTSLRFVIGFLFLLLWNIGSGDIADVGIATMTDWMFLLIISIVSGVVSLFIYYRGLSTTKASVASIAELGFPVAAVIIHVFTINATIMPLQMFAMLILLLSVLMLGRAPTTRV